MHARVLFDEYREVAGEPRTWIELNHREREAWEAVAVIVVEEIEEGIDEGIEE